VVTRVLHVRPAGTLIGPAQRLNWGANRTRNARLGRADGRGCNRRDTLERLVKLQVKR
jgi:hypothetical protein